MAAQSDDITKAIGENLAHTDYGAMLVERGITTAAIGDDGSIVEYRPDGSTRYLDAGKQ